ncbi:MAG: glycoside hydrolase family 43 protein [Prevotella sp.]|nr:glycoside hydrolase family 43 protein [Prevotella sp.]
MKRVLLLIAVLAALCQNTEAQYRNPIIPGYHPDPSICRVGDDYYIVNSSFQYFPGVPVYHSKDLVNWELIGNVLDRESQLPLKGASSWLGIYAPTLRYNDGTYYMITTNVGNGGNFMVTASDPRGPWSEPIWLKQDGIDPSLYFEDGKCYMVSNPDNTITLCQIDPKTGEQLTKSKALWRGTGGRYPEGPHIYKKDGYYYLLISEGGTELAHRLTVARSENIEGPYTANPANPLLTHCSMAGQGSPIQGTGHGDFVQAKDGSWWTVFLAYRNFGGSYHHLGRETYLAPMVWKKGEWPVVNGGNPVDTLMKVRLPKAKGAAPATGKRHICTTFDKPLGPEWVYIQNPDTMHYQRAKGKLRLIAGLSSLTENHNPTFVGRRQESEAFAAETRLDFTESLAGDEAGLTVYQIHDGHADFCLRQTKKGMSLVLKMTMKSVSFVKKEIPIPSTCCTLRVTSDGSFYRFSYSVDGQTYQDFDKIDCPLLSTEVVGGFTGVVLGMYASLNRGYVGNGLSYADFDYFDYAEH